MKEMLLYDRNGQVWTPRGCLGSADEYSVRERMNALGADQNITTLTELLPQVYQQKYLQYDLSNYVPIMVGQGNPYMSQLFNWAIGINGTDFEAGLAQMASADSNIYNDDIAVEPIFRDVTTWIKNVQVNTLEQGIFDAGTGNMDLLAEKLKARKKEYDLGIQKTTFLGLKSAPTKFGGLLTQSDVTDNTTLVTKTLAAMTDAEFLTFAKGFVKAFQENCNYTAYPTRFVVPETDLTAMKTSFISGTYPLAGSTKYEVLLNMGKSFTPDFEILGCVYCQPEFNKEYLNVGTGKTRYALYNHDADAINLQIPIDFTVTLPYQLGIKSVSTAYSRFSGVKAMRNKELLYFSF